MTVSMNKSSTTKYLPYRTDVPVDYVGIISLAHKRE